MTPAEEDARLDRLDWLDWPAAPKTAPASWDGPKAQLEGRPWPGKGRPRGGSTPDTRDRAALLREHERILDDICRRAEGTSP